MYTFIQIIATIIALISVSTYDNNIANNRLERYVNLFVKILSSIYLYMIFVHIMIQLDQDIISIFFVHKLNYDLYKIIVNVSYNLVMVLFDNSLKYELYFSTGLFLLFDNKDYIVNYMFLSIIFNRLIIPLIKIILNKVIPEINIIEEKKDLRTCIIVLGIIYLFILIII